jgi:hypothetical protein
MSFLINTLDMNTILESLSCLLTGKSMIFHSTQVGSNSPQKYLTITIQLSLVTAICEMFLSLLFPLSSKGAYIPILPLDLLQIIESPVPFVLGTLSSNIENLSIGTHVYIENL